MAHHNFIARRRIALIVSLLLPLILSAVTARSDTNQPNSLEVERMVDESLEYYKQGNLDELSVPLSKSWPRARRALNQTTRL